MDAITNCRRRSLPIESFLTRILHSCEGMVLWRGHFTATGNEEHFQLSINGGKGEKCVYADCFQLTIV
jgi:hypothetical protein